MRVESARHSCTRPRVSTSIRCNAWAIRPNRLIRAWLPRSATFTQRWFTITARMPWCLAVRIRRDLRSSRRGDRRGLRGRTYARARRARPGHGRRPRRSPCRTSRSRCRREGRNRQLRRMAAAVGFPVLRLIRTAIGDWRLENLKPGELRRETVNLPKTTRSQKTSRRQGPGAGSNSPKRPGGGSGSGRIRRRS